MPLSSRDLRAMESQMRAMGSLHSANQFAQQAAIAEAAEVASLLPPSIPGVIEIYQPSGHVGTDLRNQAIGFSAQGETSLAHKLEQGADTFEAAEREGPEAVAALLSHWEETARQEEERTAPKKRKFGVVGPSWKSDGTRRTETMLEQGGRHHPILTAAAAAIAAPAVGALVAPASLAALGAIGGGATFGALEHGVEGIPAGAVKGAAFAATAPTIAEKLGFKPSVEPGMATPEMEIFGHAPRATSGFNNLAAHATGLDSRSLLHILGVPKAPSIGGGIGLWGNAGEKGLLDSILSKSTVDTGKKLFDLAKTIHDMRSTNKELAAAFPGGRTDHTTHSELIGVEFMPHTFKETKIGVPHLGRGESALEALARFLPYRSKPKKTLYEESLQLNPLKALLPIHYSHLHNPVTAKTKHFNHGGGVHQGGYEAGTSGGTTDDVPTYLPAGSYVMDATTVSLLGDGNSNNGAQKLDQFVRKFTHSGIAPFDESQHNIKALISDGEYVVPKQVVDMLGNGNNQQGAKILDKMRNRLRKQKGVKPFLPPKAKPIEKYMAGGK